MLEGTTPVYGDLSLVRYRHAASPKAMPQTRNQRSQTNTCQRNACSSTGADGVKGIQEGLFNTRLPQRKPWRAGRVAAGRRTARCYAPPMLRPIADLPDGVLGFEATGEIQAKRFPVAEREQAIAWAAGDG